MKWRCFYCKAFITIDERLLEYYHTTSKRYGCSNRKSIASPKRIRKPADVADYRSRMAVVRDHRRSARIAADKRAQERSKDEKDMRRYAKRYGEDDTHSYRRAAA